jgi:quercetin dioxygenase-like cupin family protein
VKVQHRTPVHEDARGSILDIVTDDVFEHATLITSKAGARRGDHWHERTWQTVYVLSGRLLAYARMPEGPVEALEIGPGDVLVNEPMEMHALVALEDSVFLVLTAGPRGGDSFESDTYRLEQPLSAGALG